MTIHGLLRHVGIDVPDFIFVGDEMIVESKNEEDLVETFELVEFMTGSDSKVLVRLIRFFSQKTGDLDPKYLHPRELKDFWWSLNEYDKTYYRLVFEKGE